MISPPSTISAGNPAASWPATRVLSSASSADGHVNYIQTPFRVTATPHNVSITFKGQNDSPQYEMIDSTDTLPATVHIFFEKQDNDLREPNGRWWSYDSGYNLDSQDNETTTIVVPLTSDKWSNVYGQHDSNSIYAAFENVGWIGVTFGGRDFWGHGVAVSHGSAKYSLVSFAVN